MGYLLRCARYAFLRICKKLLRLSATVYASILACAQPRVRAATSRILSGRNSRKACRKSTDWHRSRVSCDSNIGRRMRLETQAFPSVNPFVNLLFVRWKLYSPSIGSPTHLRSDIVLLSNILDRQSARSTTIGETNSIVRGSYASQRGIRVQIRVTCLSLINLCLSRTRTRGVK